jgi:hypothetical protein
LEEFIARWSSELQFLPNEDVAREYFTRLYDLLATHKELVRALLGASAFEDEFNEGDVAEPHLSRQLGRLSALLEDQRQARGMSSDDLVFSSRIGFGAVVATAVLEDWIFPKGDRRPSRTELIEHLATYAIYSTRSFAGEGETPRPAAKRRRVSSTARKSK